MVELKHSFEDNCKNQYESISDVFPGKILEVWRYGMQLRVAERVEKSSKYIYLKRSGFDYWIKHAGRNVHFYLGKSFKYTCIVSSVPLETRNVVHLFKESV